MQPTAYAVLNTPAALSLIVPEWITPSESLTPSMISERSGTKMIEHEHPNKASPPADRVILL